MPIFKTSPQPNQATLAEFLAEPSVQMVMNTGHVTHHEEMELIGAMSSKLGARSKIELGEFVAVCGKVSTFPKSNWHSPREWQS